MGTVKYSGPVASFHCPTNAEIRSLKVHFSPKQEGSGDPSPENIRPIVGWNGVVVHNDDGNVVPNVSETVTIDWLEDIGTVYGGWVDLISGEVCEKWRLITGNDLTTITAPTSTSSPWNHIFTIGLWNNTTGTWDKAKGGSNIISDVAITGNSNTNQSVFGISNSADMYLRDDSISTQEEFLEKYGDKYIAYEIATPNTYHLAPTALQTFLGQNNVWSNANYVEVEYDLHETQTLLQRKAFIIANQPHIESASGTIVSFKTDLRAPLKKCKAYFSPKQDLHGYSNPWPAGGGKNLFNWNVTEQNPDNITNNSSANRIFTDRTYSVGFAYSNYFNPSKITDYSISNGVISLTASAGGYGIGYAISLEESTQYIISGNFTGEASVYVAYFSEDGTYLGSQNNIMAESSGGKFTTPQYTKIVIVLLTLSIAGSGTFSNIQLEKGSTATAYAPYENICPIEGWEGLSVCKAGKNLFDASNVIVGKWVRAGTISVNNPLGSESDSSGWSCSDYLNVKPLTTYTITYPDSTSAAAAGLVYFTAKTMESAISGVTTVQQGIIRNTKLDYTFTTPANCNYIRFCWMNSKGNNCQLELGSTATTYAPYSGTTIPVDWTSEAGTIYGGYVDLMSGEVWKTHEELIYDGSSDESWAVSDQGSFVGAQSDVKNDVRNLCPLCNKFLMEQAYGNQSFRIRPIGNQQYASSVADWRTWLSNNPIQVVYELETPSLIITLTPTQLKTLVGINNIWSNTNGTIEAKFYTH